MNIIKTLTVAAALIGAAAQVQAQLYNDERVRGYDRQDGTHVDSYMRTAPDGNPFNNYSTQGNVNPYTGQPGTHSPVTQSPFGR